MKMPSEPSFKRELIRAKIIGLGDRSMRKSYYPELQKQLNELEKRVNERTTELREANAKLQEEIQDHKKTEAELEKLFSELWEALAKVKQLSGLLPICSSCKKIRDDRGYWNQIETYIKEHSEAEFSHGLCPDCLKKLYPDLIKHND